MRRAAMRRGVCCAVVLAGALSAAGSVHAEAPQVLLDRYSCTICHAEREAKTGPAYVDVAAKYRHEPKAVSILAAVIRKGSHGNGPWHMPPHPEVSSGDAATMAKYILSLKR